MKNDSSKAMAVLVALFGASCAALNPRTSTIHVLPACTPPSTSAVGMDRGPDQGTAYGLGASPTICISGPNPLEGRRQAAGHEAAAWRCLPSGQILLTTKTYQSVVDVRLI